MFKTITINNKEYHLEYTVEAALYGDATQKLMDFLIHTVSGNTDDPTEAIKENLRTVADVPQTALTLFYAGLLEHHGPFGDNTIRTVADAKRLVRDYFEDHAEDGTDNFMDILTMCLDQMGEDGFFKRVGLEKMFQAAEPEPVNREQRRAAAKRKTKATEE